MKKTLSKEEKAYLKQLKKKFTKEEEVKRLEQEKKDATLDKQLKNEEAPEKKKLIWKGKNYLKETPKKLEKQRRGKNLPKNLSLIKWSYKGQLLRVISHQLGNLEIMGVRNLTWPNHFKCLEGEEERKNPPPKVNTIREGTL